LNQPSTPSQPATDLESAVSADEATLVTAPEFSAQETAPPADETPPAVAAETTPEPTQETAAADVTTDEPADPGAATLMQVADEAPHSVTAAQEPSPPVDEAEAAETLRAEARAIKARWMAAHDLDEAQVEPRIQERKAPATAVTPAEALQDVSGRKEPTFDAPPVEAKSAEPRIQERKAPAPAATPTEALQGVSGRKEPTFDASPVEAKAAEPDSQEWPWTPPAIAAALDEAHDNAAPVAKAKQADAAVESPSSLSIEALEAVSGRREPTLDVPVAKKKSKARKASPQPAPQPEAPRATEPSQPKRRIELPTRQTRIEARRLDAMRADPQMAAHRPASQRSEPEAWEVMPPVPMSAQGGRHKTTWAIGLGAVLLLIGLTAPAAFLRHTGEQTPSVTGAITPAPEESAQGPAAETARPPAQATNAAVPATAPSQRPKQAAEVPAAQPPRAATEPQVADVPQPTIKPDTSDAAPEQDAPATPDTAPEQQAALGAVQDGGVLEEAPIAAPPSPEASRLGPTVNLASREAAEPVTFGQPRPLASPMIARPYVPEAKPGQVLRVPTTGAATVPIDGATASAPATLSAPRASAAIPPAAPAGSVPGAPVGLKPTLIPVLKPQASGSPAAQAPALRAATGTAPQPKAATRQGQSIFPTPFEQMLNTLADTLGEGQPPNPALRPPPGANK
jgi:hypothetical protein